MLYFQAINTGYGFITHEDRAAFDISGLCCDLWLTSDNAAARAWAVRNNAVELTQEEAQAIIDANPPTPGPIHE